MPEANITLGMDIGPALAKLDQIPAAVKATAGQANAAMKLDGAGALKADIDGATDAIVSHGKETNKLTEFIHTQRTAQREQAFLFRESRQAIMGISMAYMALRGDTANATESQKKLDSAIMGGIGTFQVADFAIAGLGLASGGTAIAIAGIITVGAGLISYFKESQKAGDSLNASLEKQHQLLVDLKLAPKELILADLREKINSEQAILDKMKIGEGGIHFDFGKLGREDIGGTTVKDYEDQINKILELQKQYKDVFEKQETGLIPELKEEISQLEIKRNLSKNQNEINQLGLDIDKKKHDLSLIENNMGRIPLLKDEVSELEKKQNISESQSEIDRLGLDIEKKKHELAIAELGTAKEHRLEELNKINLERIELGLKPLTREELDYEQNKLFQMRMQNDALQGNIKLIGQKTDAEKKAQDQKDATAKEKPPGAYYGDTGSAGEEQHNVDIINYKLMNLNLTEEERNQLLRERKTLLDDIDSKLGKQDKDEKRLAEAESETMRVASHAVDELVNVKDNSVRNDLNNEKKTREDALNTEEQEKLDHAKTQKAKDAINVEYAAKKDALDKEMDAKYRASMKSAWEVQKAFAIAQATVNTYEAAAKALTVGPIIGEILAAIVIAAGLADVAAITSTQPQGLAKGTRITKPTLAMIGEGDDNEYVAPEQDFMTAAKDYLIPQTLDLIARDGINVAGYRSIQESRNQISAQISTKRMERQLSMLNDNLSKLELTATIDDRKLLFIVENRKTKNLKINI
jgi:hypothetical protein